MTETITKIKPVIKTFKDVHADLENEFLFINKEHDIQRFKEKAEFLKTIGFGNSIATKLYDSISENINIIREYSLKYNNKYKFILKPQLERVCEKYDLYLREPKYFLGDIPEKNIKDIMDFEVAISDLYEPNQQIDKYGRFFETPSVVTNGLISQQKLNELLNKRNLKYKPTLDSRNDKLITEAWAKLTDLSKCNINLMKIAAVKNLFSPSAFDDSNTRIIENKQELEAKNQVEIDPIVLCETKHGYLIITAWGDEANDELIFKQTLN